MSFFLKTVVVIKLQGKIYMLHGKMPPFKKSLCILFSTYIYIHKYLFIDCRVLT